MDPNEVPPVGTAADDPKGKGKVVSEEVESDERPPGFTMEDRIFKEEGRWSGYCPGPLMSEMDESVGDTDHPPVIQVPRR